jgi:murein DD-endopeptidase MepM/ murein hydrolase activator NlpD
VLSATAGRVDFDTDRLGGRIARVVTADGGWWYYAHLSGWNTKLRDGESVRVGDVIGFCGKSGDASVPHVHLGWYSPSGVARDPIRHLIGWLRAAERRLGVKFRPAASSVHVRDVGGAELGVTPPAPSEASSPPVGMESGVLAGQRGEVHTAAALGVLGRFTLPLVLLVGLVGLAGLVRRRRRSDP